MGSPRRSLLVSLARRAQSRGEWPGSRITFREGFVGLEECDGGGARVEVPGWRAELASLLGSGRFREGAAERRDELFMPFSVGGRGGGGMSIAGVAMAAEARGAGAEGNAASDTRATAAADAGGEDESENEGTDPGGEAALALGVVCGEISSIANVGCVTPFCDNGRSMFGGGGIAARSRSARRLGTGTTGDALPSSRGVILSVVSVRGGRVLGG